MGFPIDKSLRLTTFVRNKAIKQMKQRIKKILLFILNTLIQYLIGECFKSIL